MMNKFRKYNYIYPMQYVKTNHWSFKVSSSPINGKGDIHC